MRLWSVQYFPLVLHKLRSVDLSISSLLRRYINSKVEFLSINYIKNQVWRFIEREGWVYEKFYSDVFRFKIDFLVAPKGKNRLRKEINRLRSKGMSNIYLKATAEKSWRSQHFEFLSLKNLSPVQSWGSSNSRIYNLILKPLVSS